MNKNNKEKLITDANVSHCVTMHIEPRPVCSVTTADSPSTEPDNVGQAVGLDEQAAQSIVEFAANNGRRSQGGEQPGRIVTPSPPAASEEGHWYLPDGTPFYTYVNKKGETKPVTLRQARPVNAVPSVTTVMKIADRPAINNYFERHIFDVMLSVENNKFPGQREGESDDGYFKRIKAASREHRDAKATRGTALHAEIERFLRIDLVEDKSWLPHIANLVRATAQYGINLRNGEPEKSFAHGHGFGGKVDYHEKAYLMPTGIVHPGGSFEIHGVEPGLVIDFKTKDSIEHGKRYAYDEHAMQLAAYREGLGIANARCINVFVGAGDREILIHEWPEEDLRRGWRMFQLFLSAWKEKHYYWPKHI